jgi:hypothetical protein
MLPPMDRCSNGWPGRTCEKKRRESDGRSRPVVRRQQVMRDVKERRDKKSKIPLCARSEVVKIKYPRTCRIHICADIICCAFTEFWTARHALQARRLFFEVSFRQCFGSSTRLRFSIPELSFLFSTFEEQHPRFAPFSTLLSQLELAITVESERDRSNLQSQYILTLWGFWDQ